MINPVIAENIDIKKIDEGHVIFRLVQLAKEKNIDYIPTAASVQAMHAYCLRKGIAPPKGMEAGSDAPIYAPMPGPMIFDPNIDNQGGSGGPSRGMGAQQPGYGGVQP